MDDSFFEGDEIFIIMLICNFGKIVIGSFKIFEVVIWVNDDVYGVFILD